MGFILSCDLEKSQALFFLFYFVAGVFHSQHPLVFDSNVLNSSDELLLILGFTAGSTFNATLKLRRYFVVELAGSESLC